MKSSLNVQVKNVVGGACRSPCYSNMAELLKYEFVKCSSQWCVVNISEIVSLPGGPTKEGIA
jgi:hypothetical protein